MTDIGYWIRASNIAGRIAGSYSPRLLVFFSLIYTVLAYLILRIFVLGELSYFIYIVPISIILLVSIYNINFYRTKERRKAFLKGFFSTHRSKEIVKNHYEIKATLFYSVITLFIFIIITNLQLNLTNITKDNYFAESIIEESSTLIQIFLINLIGSALSALIPKFYSEFKLYFAKECCLLATSNNIDEMEKIRYILQSLDWYNKYLNKSLDLQIKNRAKVFNKIVLELYDENNSFINEIKDALDKGNINLVRVLSSKFNTKKDTNEKNSISDIFLTEFTPLDKIRGLSEFIVPIVTVVVSIIAIVYKL